MESLINIGIILTYLMIGIGALITIGFGIKKMISNTENTKKTIYTIGSLGAVILFSYLMASDEVLKSYEKYEVTSTTARRVGIGLITFYVLAIGAIGMVIYSELSKVFSK